jgi:hypothetical protein
MARRTRAERDRARVLGWWAAIIVLGWYAWDSGRLGLWVLPFLAWAYYQLCAAPKLCGVETTKGHPCKNRAYGRLMACTEPSHYGYKRDALLRLLGVRRPPRQITAPATSGPRPGRAPVEQSLAEPATLNSRQRALTILTVALTIIGTVATVIQTLLAARQ